MNKYEHFCPKQNCIISEEDSEFVYCSCFRTKEAKAIKEWRRTEDTIELSILTGISFQYDRKHHENFWDLLEKGIVTFSQG